MNKKILIGLLVVVVAVAYVIARTKKPTEDIKIGAVISMTGPAASYGENAQKAMQLAVEEINAKGGFGGRKVVLTVEDDHTDPKAAISAYQKLASIDKVDAIVGGLWDFVAQPIIPLAQTDKKVFITPTNFRIAGSFELNDYSFAMLPELSSVVAKLKEYLSRTEINKVAVVHFSSDFGKTFASTISGIMSEQGKPAIIDEAYNEIGNNDFRTTVTKLKSAKVDTVFLDMVDVDAANFLTRAKEQGFRPQVVSHVLIRDVLSNKSLDSSLVEGVVFLNWEIESSEFADRFNAKYGSMPAHSAGKSYNAIYVLANAIVHTEKTEDLNNGVASSNTKTINGTVVFNDKHTVDTTDVELSVIKDGKVVPLNP